MAQLNERAWTSLIEGHVRNERWQLALYAFQEMRDGGVNPSTFTFVPLLKACAKLSDVETGRQLHTQIAKMGCNGNLHVGRMLLGMYAKCGSLPEARIVFAKLPLKNAISWNVLIAGYSEHGPYEDALKCFEQMQLEGITPNAVTLASVIKLCGVFGAFDKGREIYIMLVKDTTKLDLSVGNTFIGMFAKCGSLVEAQEVFDKLLVRDVVTWTALIAGYSQHGPAEKALECFRQMEHNDISPNAVTFSCIVRACGSLGDLEEGQDMHAYIVKEQFESDAFVGNSLVDLYAKCGSLTEAQEIFQELTVRDVVSWTALITGYAEQGCRQDFLKALDDMQSENISLDAVSYACSLKACSISGATDRGLLLHAEISREGFEGDLAINNTLIAMYAKFNLFTEAEDVFNLLTERSVVSWTALIAGYSEHGYCEPVLKFFHQMQIEGFAPSDVTYCCVLKACGSTGALDQGIKFHQQVSEEGLERDSAVGTTLVGMYSKCGLLSRARDVFEKLPVQDVTAWTAMIAGYAEHGPAHEALNWLEQMKRKQVSSNAITYVCALKACANTGALIKTREIHEEATMKGYEMDSCVSNSVVGAYAKCGSFMDACFVLSKSPSQEDVVGWSSIIKGYAANQEHDMALQCFQKMQQEGVKPDAVSFLCLLTACGYGSMVFKAQEFFDTMECYAVAPTPQHFSSMADLFARAGFLDEAEIFLEMLSPSPEVTRLGLLSACKTYREEEVGLRCFKWFVEFNRIS